jgi:hypothetical protein
MIVAKHTCPRRNDDAVFVESDKDGWDHRADMFLWCTYCGSLQPDMFISLMQQGIELGPTDKNYKVYLTGPGGGHLGKFYFQHLTRDLQIRFIELYNEKPRKFTIGYPGHFYVLPFFVRLDEGVNNDDNA